MNESIQYQRSTIPNDDESMAKAKVDLTKFCVNKGGMLSPGYAWLLVSSYLFFFHCITRIGQEGVIHPDTLVKLPIYCLKTNEALNDGFESKNGFFS